MSFLQVMHISVSEFNKCWQASNITHRKKQWLC